MLESSFWWITQGPGLGPGVHDICIPLLNISFSSVSVINARYVDTVAF